MTEERAISSALGLLDLTRRAAEIYGRTDLVGRLDAARRRAADPSFRILVVGEYKKGKSSLINALLNAPICPVDDDVATAVPTIVRYADEPVVTLFFDGEGSELVEEEVGFEDLADYVTEVRNPGNERGLRVAVVGVPRQLLADGLELVDTPGVGGLGSAHTAATIAALPMADAVVFVSDASQEYTAPELEFLSRAQDLCPHVLCVMTKIDFYPEWRRVGALNEEHLRRYGAGAALVTLSAPLRIEAVELGDNELNTESGFPPLIDWLGRMGADAERITLRSLAHDALWVCSQLQSMVAAEQAALADPAAAAALVSELTRARERAEALKAQSARWYQTLSDGIADLSSDVDHDLRARTREVLQVAEESIDGGDPLQVWEDFEAWLKRRASYEVAENYGAMTERTLELATRVQEHFQGVQDDVMAILDVPPPVDELESVVVRGELKKKDGLGALGLTGVRSAYGSILMVGMLGKMVGLAAIIVNPLTIGATVLLGWKAIKEHRQRELQARRMQAKTAVRQYLDELSFRVGKDSRDSLRRVHRELRDSFTARAEELHRSTSEALVAAQRSVQVADTQRKQRGTQIDDEVGRLAALRRRIAALAPELEARGEPVGAAR